MFIGYSRSALDQRLDFLEKAALKTAGCVALKGTIWCTKKRGSRNRPSFVGFLYLDDLPRIRAKNRPDTVGELKNVSKHCFRETFISDSIRDVVLRERGFANSIGPVFAAVSGGATAVAYHHTQ